MTATPPAAVEFTAAGDEAQTPPPDLKVVDSEAPYGRKKDGSPRQKPGRKAAADRPAAKKRAKKAPPKKAAAKKKRPATSGGAAKKQAPAPAKKAEQNGAATKPKVSRGGRGRRVKANNHRAIRPEENGQVQTSSMNRPKRGYTEADAIEMLRVGYSVEHVEKRTGYIARWLNRQKIPSTPLVERIGKK